MGYWLPSVESQLNQWAENFVSYVNTNMIELGLDADMIAPVNTKHGVWNAKYPAHLAKQLAAKVGTDEKDAARDDLKAAVRVLVKRINGNPNVTQAQKEAMGIVSTPDEVPAGLPAVTRPLVFVDIKQRMQHKVTFVDEADPDNKKTPKGIYGCEIRVKVGPVPPVDPSEMSVVTVAANAPYVVEYTGAQAGQTAHYMTRWIDSAGQPSPWSETVSATIAA